MLDMHRVRDYFALFGREALLDDIIGQQKLTGSDSLIS